MVQSLDRSVTLVAKDTFGAHFPALLRGVLTVLCLIFEYLGWPSEIAHVMGINTTFRVVRLPPVWAPARFIFEHVESENLHGLKEGLQVLVQSFGVEEAAEDEIVLEADALEGGILFAYLFVILEGEVFQIVWGAIIV